MLSSSWTPLAVAVLIIGVVVAQDCSQPPRMHPGRCCNVPKLVDHDTMHSCMRNRVKRGFGGHGGPDSCALECVFKAAGFLQNGVISYDQIKTSLTNNAAGNQELINAINNALTKCVNTDGTPKASAMPSNAGSTSCNVNSAAIFGCIHRELLLNCPASLATNSDECTAFKTFIQSCPPPAFT